MYADNWRMRSPDLTTLRGRRVLVTGAASGIGRACAQAAAADGAQLVLTDVNPSGLQTVVAELTATGATVAHSVALDITDIDAVTRFATQVHEQGGAVDVIMNVAGVSAWGTVQTLEHRQWRSMVEVNLMGPIHVIEAFVPTMIEARRGGWLVNVSSAAGLIGLPWHAAYSASKFGLRGVSEVLRFDLRRHGIGVSLVCPGGVATPLTDTVEVAGIDKNAAQWRRMHARFVRRAVSPEQAAAAIITGVRRRRYLIYTSRDIQLLFALQRWAPPVYGLVMRVMNAAMSRVAARSRPA
jgi:NAD(P)-dependent dehydrogenase (short-subunit alcohol dehydrogenase family)